MYAERKHLPWCSRPALQVNQSRIYPAFELVPSDTGVEAIVRIRIRRLGSSVSGCKPRDFEQAVGWLIVVHFVGRWRGIKSFMGEKNQWKKISSRRECFFQRLSGNNYLKTT